MRNQKLIDRFMSKVSVKDDGDCWEWTASRNPQGYGKFRVFGKHVSSHRVAYELFVSMIPPGMCVCHRCDNPGCVNTKHLFIGTHKDNIQDSIKKGRRPKLRGNYNQGKSNGRAKLTNAECQSILMDNRNHGSIAAAYGVSRKTVWLIKNKKHYSTRPPMDA